MRAKQVLRGLVTVACLAVLVWIVDLQLVASHILAANPVFLLAALVVAGADRVLMVAKWLPLLRVQAPSASLMGAARSYIASGLGLYLLPVSVGADVLRATSVGRVEGAIPQVSASIVVERLLGLAASGLLSVVALVVALSYSVKLTFLLPWAILSIAVGIAALLLPSNRWLSARLSRSLGSRHFWGIGRFLSKFGSALGRYRSQPILLLWVGLASVVEQVFPVVVMYLLALALGLSVDLAMLLVVMPLTLFAARLPISAGGVGVAEGSIVYLLGLFGVSVQEAVALSVLGRLVDILVVAVPGAFLWQHLIRKRRPGTVEQDSGEAMIEGRSDRVV